jgi:hypothetical protein
VLMIHHGKLIVFGGNLSDIANHLSSAARYVMSGREYSLLWIGKFRQSVSTPSIIWLDLFFSLTNSSSGSKIGLEEEEEDGNTQTTLS